MTKLYFNFQIDEEAEEEAKSMDLNKVVLRFQAFHYDKNIENYRPITLPVDSDVVFNLSELITGENVLAAKKSILMLYIFCMIHIDMK